MEKIMKNKRGITLIALIITIIILLILAGITINQLTENGLFEKIQLAKQKSEQAQLEENETLKNYENEIKEYVDGTRDTTNEIGKIYSKSFSNLSIEKETTTILSSITLPAGKYILVGFAYYVGFDLRYHIAIGSAISSAYDDRGYVGMNVTDIVEADNETTYNLELFVSKDCIVKGNIKAIKIGN